MLMLRILLFCLVPEIILLNGRSFTSFYLVKTCLNFIRSFDPILIAFRLNFITLCKQKTSQKQSIRDV